MDKENDVSTQFWVKIKQETYKTSIEQPTKQVDNKIKKIKINKILKIEIDKTYR